MNQNRIEMFGYLHHQGKEKLDFLDLAFEMKFIDPEEESHS